MDVYYIICLAQIIKKTLAQPATPESQVFKIQNKMMKQNSGKRNEEEIKENKKQEKKFKKGRKARKNYLKNTNLFIY